MNDNNEKSFDAIVVGTGITGGWAAKELCEKGLKTLVLERGRMVEHVKDYPYMNKEVWDMKNAGQSSPEHLKRYEKQSRFGSGESFLHFFVDDQKHPYNEEKRFDWIRGYHVGGRSIMWGRQCYRLSDLDFEANDKDGIGVDWPVRYKDISPWYDYVEKYIGVSGQKLGLKHLPDSIFLKPMELNCLELHLKKSLSENYDDRLLTIGRVANITEGTKSGTRGTCQYRNKCYAGCPYGAYFSSNSSTLPAAAATGNMNLRPYSIVSEILFDSNTQKATGVRVIDAQTKESIEYKSKLVFLCASTVGSTSILLNSKSPRFPNGMGNDSGELGHNLMDHHFKVGARGNYEGFKDKYYKGKRANGIYIPRFRNVDEKSKKVDFIRGYGYQGGAGRYNWEDYIKEFSFGKKLKEAISKPGDWTMGMTGFGETLPYHENQMYLNYSKLDEWGLPTVTFDAEYKENELKMRIDIKNQAAEMLENAGFKEIETFDDIGGMGLAIHEMGTARMGKNPETSVLNGYNQIHAVNNVFVTDGSFMSSSANQNPSLTYMAFTARAVDHAVTELKKRNL